MTRRSGRALAGAAALLVAGFTARAHWTAQRQSVTVDEFAHVPAGIAYLAHGAFHVYATSPPLARMVLALPALARSPVVPTIPLADGSLSPHWVYAHQFQEANGERVVSLVAAARGAAAILGALLALVVFYWSKRLWGTAGGLASLALVAFEPNLIAHAGLATTDVAFCAAAIAALAACERSLRSPGWMGVAVAGLALGAAQLTKFTALLLYPAVLVAAVLLARPLAPALARLAGMFALSLLVLNAGYLFRGTGAAATEYEFRSALCAPLGALPLRLPLPEDYVRGFDEQARDAEAFYPAYLNGTVHPRGAPWYYDWAALALKTPLAELALMISAVLLLPRLRAAARPPDAALALTLCAAAAALLMLFASRTRLDVGVRYVLLVYPLAAVAVGGLAAVLPRVLAAGLILVAVESSAALGSELPFFNVLAGGPAGGHRYLADSNLDWGQDLPALRKLMDARGLQRIHLAYFGRIDPRFYGVDFDLVPPGAPPPGWYAISMNFLVGLPYFIRDERSGETRWLQAGELSPFLDRTPDDRAGRSIRLFHVP